MSMENFGMHCPHIHNIGVGNRLLDSEHKKMLDTIHRIQVSIREKNSAAIAVDFKALDDLACDYFVIEEKVARAVGFDFTLHGMAHQNLLGKYRYVRDELAARNGSWSDSDGELYARILGNCLMRHLEYESRPLKIVLEACLYDFNPIQET